MWITRQLTSRQEFWDAMSLIYTESINIGWNLFGVIQSKIINNLTIVWLITTILAGIIGFSIGWKVYNAIPDDQEWYRSGPIRIKQIRCRMKPNRISRLDRSRHFKKVKVTPEMIEARPVHHSRYNNLGHHNRHELPRVVLIRQVEDRIKHLKSTIDMYEARLKKLKSELNRNKSFLKELKSGKSDKRCTIPRNQSTRHTT